MGLEEAGHTNEVLDLYAMKFDPVLKTRDFPNWIDENFPLETLKGKFGWYWSFQPNFSYFKIYIREI